MFSLFSELNITLKSHKFYLKYSNITLLEQHVNVLNLTTEKKKMKVIKNLQFSKTLKNLKTYLDLMKWLYFYILYYVQIITSLQLHKTELLHQLLKDSAQKTFIYHISMNFTSKEIKTFITLQKLFTKSIFLTHFNSVKHLYINVDTSKQYEFETVIYYVNKDSVKTADIQWNKIHFILFLSKLLTSVKKKYWFTELETAVLMWIVCKTHHIIETSDKSKTTVVFTDHLTTILIVKQTYLITMINTDKLNLQLVHTS